MPVAGNRTLQFIKLILVALVGVPLCFAVTYLVRRIPLAARII